MESRPREGRCNWNQNSSVTCSLSMWMSPAFELTSITSIAPEHFSAGYPPPHTHTPSSHQSMNSLSARSLFRVCSEAPAPLVSVLLNVGPDPIKARGAHAEHFHRGLRELASFLFQVKKCQGRSQGHVKVGGRGWQPFFFEGSA